jgi:hypothetical protein
MLEFKVCHGGENGMFIDGSIYLTVSNGYITDNAEEHAEVKNTIRRLLVGEQGLSVEYRTSIPSPFDPNSRCAAGFFRIQDDWFELYGGYVGAQLGFTTGLKARYSENKKAIDAFMEYMLLNPPDFFRSYAYQFFINKYD